MNSTTPAMSVVRFESRIGDERLVAAGADAACGVLPLPQLLADALEDQHVGVDRHADREHDARDAGQGQRRAGISDITATIMMTFTNSAMFASMPNTRYQRPMKITTSR